jgi:head-tail adaptor
MVEYSEAIEKGSLREVLLAHVSFLCRNNVKEAFQHDAWLHETYAKRNQIVHKGLLGATAEDAQRAFESTIAFINHIAAKMRIARR